jgi:hypothetical protein
MNREKLFQIVISVNLLAFMLVACSSTSGKVPIMPDSNEPLSTFVDLGEQLSGWHHFDITKDHSGLIQVYLDGEWILEHLDELPFDVKKMTFYFCCEGPALDNVVVRDDVIEVQPAE